eukprot:Nitzschia sp. Nitz4//scaffold23_size168460//99921//102428//NITZ4_002227-RA/size168460-processed-gene-0.265-mRNA-1//-1//CDS//3329543659//7643//frame0
MGSDQPPPNNSNNNNNNSYHQLGSSPIPGLPPFLMRPMQSDSSDGPSSGNQANQTPPQPNGNATQREGSTFTTSDSTESAIPVVGEGTVSADQERQVLLLMLLAQVCALHDPTPKTFTIHVVELFERGILDRDSIHFLFELGLVPSLTPTRAMLTGATAASATANANDSDAADVSEELALATLQNPNWMTSTNMDAQQRSAEAYAIRSMLAQIEQLHHQQQQQKQKLPRRRDRPSDQHSPKDDSPTNGNANNNNDDNNNPKPWDIKHFPLSLSRYQRDFQQVALLAAGSFGQVFHAKRHFDGCDYAVKRVDFDATGYSNETIQQVVREVECLAKVSDHPNVVRYFTSWLEPSWMTGGKPPDAAPSAGPRRVGVRADNPQLAWQDATLESDSDSDDDCFQAKSITKFANVSYAYEEESTSYFGGGGMDVSSSGGGMWQRRAFSFESSVESGEPTWESYYDPSMDEYNGGNAMHGSNAKGRPSRRGQHAQQQQQQQQSKPALAPYRYQISLYIQMQLCHPASLADWIRERNATVPESANTARMGPALEIFEQIVQGLGHVHTMGIVHRDLKPANIFASRDGKVIKIGDFGLSRELGELQRGTPSRPTSPTKGSQDHWHSAKKGGNSMIVRHTNQALAPFQARATTVDPLTAGVGTRSYAAPEQLSSKSYSTAADIFSLGLIFLELVCCFETEHERLHNFQECRNGNLPCWIAELDPQVASILLACTRPDPDERPTAGDILQLLHSKRPPRRAYNHYPAALSSSGPIISESVQEVPSSELQDDAASATTLNSTTLLRESLKQRDEALAQHKRELEEKDREIERLRQEMERMMAGRDAG